MNTARINQSIRLNVKKMHTSIINKILKNRTCLKNEIIVYACPMESIGKIIKYDAGPPKKRHTNVLGRGSPWQVRFNRETVRLDLRPELYGNMSVRDGWKFVNEAKIFKKCK
jgi:hypothetical protein